MPSVCTAASRHDRDRDGGAGHVDGRAERDGHGVELLIQTEALAQGHVHGDVRGGRAREESGHAALLEALKHQRIGILAHGDKGHNGVDDERREQHAAHEQEQQLAVLGEACQTARGHGRNTRPRMPKGARLMTKRTGLRDGLGGVGEEALGRICSALEREAEHDGPEQDAEEVAADDRADGVGDDVGQQVREDLREALGRSCRKPPRSA